MTRFWVNASAVFAIVFGRVMERVLRTPDTSFSVGAFMAWASVGLVLMFVIWVTRPRNRAGQSS